MGVEFYLLYFAYRLLSVTYCSDIADILNFIRQYTTHGENTGFLKFSFMVSISQNILFGVGSYVYYEQNYFDLILICHWQIRIFNNFKHGIY